MTDEQKEKAIKAELLKEDLRNVITLHKNYDMKAREYNIIVSLLDEEVRRLRKELAELESEG